MISDHAKGILCGLGASTLWGSTFVASRYLVEWQGLDPYYVAALRYMTGGILLVPYVLVVSGGRKMLRGTTYLPQLLALAVVGIVIMGAMLAVSTAYTTSINSSLIVNGNAIFIALFAWLLGERVPFLRSVGLVIGLVGVAVITLSSAPDQVHPPANNLLGGIAAVVSAAAWALYTVLGKSLVRKIGGLVTSAWTIMAGGLILAAVALLMGTVRPLTQAEWLAVAYLGAFPTAVAMGLWYKGLEYIESSALGPSQYIATPVSVVLGWALLAEAINASFIAGGILVLLGVYMATKPLKNQSEDNSPNHTQNG
ncbi:MAG: EamA family transporter [Armatimonadota bacterium]